MLKQKPIPVAGNLCLMVALSTLVLAPAADARRYGFMDVVNTVKQVGGAASSLRSVRDGYRSVPSHEEPSSSTSVSGAVVTPAPVIPPPIPPVPPPSTPARPIIPGTEYDTNQYLHQKYHRANSYGQTTGDQSSSYALTQRNIHTPPRQQVKVREVTRVVRERPTAVVVTPKTPEPKPIIDLTKQPDTTKPATDTIAKFDTAWVGKTMNMLLTKM